MTLKGCDMEPKACVFEVKACCFSVKARCFGVKARVYRAKANALGIIASHIRLTADDFIAKCHITTKTAIILSIF